MSTWYEIPLTGQAQSFNIVLGVTEYYLTTRWMDVPEGGWTLDIADTNQNPIVNMMPLVTGVDLFEALAYEGFGGKLVVLSDGPDILAAPTFTNLGTGSHLYYVTP